MRGAEPSTDDGKVYPYVFGMLKHTGGLHLKEFNWCIYRPTFKVLTIKQVQQLIDLKETYLHIPMFECHHHF